jgi:hypothetical protein
MDYFQLFTQAGHIGAWFLDSRSWSSLSLVSRETNKYCESSKQFQCLKIPTTVQSKDWEQAACKHKGPIELVFYSTQNRHEVGLNRLIEHPISNVSETLHGLHFLEPYWPVDGLRRNIVKDLATHGLHELCPQLRRLTLPITISDPGDMTAFEHVCAQMTELKNLEDITVYVLRFSGDNLNDLEQPAASTSYDTKVSGALPSLRYLTLRDEFGVVFDRMRAGSMRCVFDVLMNSKTSLLKLDLKDTVFTATGMVQFGLILTCFHNLEALACSFVNNVPLTATQHLLDGLRNGHLPRTLKTLDFDLGHRYFEPIAGVLIDSIPSLAALQHLTFSVFSQSMKYTPARQRLCHALTKVIQNSQLRSITWEFSQYLGRYTSMHFGQRQALEVIDWFVPKSPTFHTAFTSRLKSLTIKMVFHGFPLNGMAKLAFSRLEAIETLRLQKCGGCFESLVEAVQAIPHKDRLSEFSLFNFQFDSSMQSFSLLPARRLHSMPSTYGARVYAAQRQIRSILPVVKAMTSLSRLTLWIGYIMTFEVMNLLGPGLDLVEFAEELRAVFLRLEYFKVSFGAPCYVIESQLSQPPSAPASLMQVREKTET